MGHDVEKYFEDPECKHGVSATGGSPCYNCVVESNESLSAENARLREIIDDVRSCIELERQRIKRLFVELCDAASSIKCMKMSMEMVCEDAAFYSSYDDKSGTHDASNPKMCLNMNDVWAWATADCEKVEWDDVPVVHELWKKGGSDALLVWACRKRNAKPQKPVFDKLPPEIQEQVKDLPRFGDEDVPVVDGKVATFTDGWGDMGGAE